MTSGTDGDVKNAVGAACRGEARVVANGVKVPGIWCARLTVGAAPYATVEGAKTP